MKISTLLASKGDSGVATIVPGATVAAALKALADHNVGALVVSEDGTSVDGIISERDIVRAAERVGTAFAEGAVSLIMSGDVLTCSPSDTVDSLMVTMTENRIRHIPVVDGGNLVGIVSIGDVVKSRIGELETDRKALVDYINAR